jgi:hypothetical protein
MVMSEEAEHVRVGITGHTNLTEDTVPLVAGAIRAILADHTALIGVSCLARGADQVFAAVVLDLGHPLEVVLPARDYRERKVKPENRERFEQLIGRATTVETLPFDVSDRAAYEAANERVLSGVDRLVAVWDGAPPDGRGGTADTVRLARERGVPVAVVWPEGAQRG